MSGLRNACNVSDNTDALYYYYYYYNDNETI